MRLSSARQYCAILLCFCLLLGGCAQQIKPFTDSFAIDENDYSVYLKNQPNMDIIAENEFLQLYADGKTATIIVYNKQSDTYWYTNPIADEDELAQGEGLTMMNSQLFLMYNDEKDISRIYYTKSDSIEHNQYTFEKLDNGLKVEYTFGKQIKLYFVPPIITLTRMNLFLDNLEEEEKDAILSMYSIISIRELDPNTQKEMTKDYPSLKNDDIYVAIGFNAKSEGNMVPEFVLQELEPYFIEAGYTQDDLMKDYQENHLDYPENQNAVFRVSICYKLLEDSLLVSVPCKEILFDTSKFKLTNLIVLPYFGAADKNAEGYMFVPDGCGAIINLNNEKTNFDMYDKILYGNDIAIRSTNIEQGDGAQCYLPVFGLKNKDDAFLAVIEKGDGSASIQADIAGRYNSYNRVSPNFIMTPQKTKSTSTISTTALLTHYQQNIMQSDIQIRYFFLSEETANYTGMAHRYQQYLINENKIKQNTVWDSKMPMNINLIGAIQYKDSFLGLSIRKTKPLTTYKQAAEIVSELADVGINKVQVTYSGWSNKGVSNSAFKKISLVNVLGSRKDFNMLTKHLSDTGNDFFPDMEMLYVNADIFFNNFSVSKEAVKDISGSTALIKFYDFATLHENNNSPGRYLVSPRWWKHYKSRLLNSYGSFKLDGLSLLSAGSDLYSDFHRNQQIDRETSKTLLTDMARDIAEKYLISSSGVNAYLLEFCSNIVNLPMESGQNYILDDSVPFYQIVLHGILPYSSIPVNLSSNIENFILKMVETGTLPNFEWMYEKNDQIKDTDYPYYSLNYSAWLKTAEKVYNILSPIYDVCKQSVITDHLTVGPGIKKTTFENGTVIYVNYNNKAVTIDGIEILAKHYSVKKS